MQPNDTPQSRTIGAALIALGVLLTASAAASALAAAAHMAVAATLCGPVAGHCLLCAVSAASLLASAAVVVAGATLLAPHPAVRSAASGGGGTV